MRALTPRNIERLVVGIVLLFAALMLVGRARGQSLTVLQKLSLVGPLKQPHLLYDSCATPEMPRDVQGQLFRACRCVPITAYWRADPSYSERASVQKMVADRVDAITRAGGKLEDTTLCVTWMSDVVPLPDAAKWPIGFEGRWALPLLTIRQLAEKYCFGGVAFIVDTERYKDFDGTGPQPTWMVEASDVSISMAIPGCSIHRYGCLGRIDPEQDGTYADSVYFDRAYRGPLATLRRYDPPGLDGEGPAELNCYYGGDIARIRQAIIETRKTIKPTTKVWLTLTCSLRGDKTGIKWGVVDWGLPNQYAQGRLLTPPSFPVEAGVADGLIEWKWSRDPEPLRWADYLTVRLLGMSQVIDPRILEPAVSWK